MKFRDLANADDDRRSPALRTDNAAERIFYGAFLPAARLLRSGLAAIQNFRNAYEEVGEVLEKVRLRLAHFGDIRADCGNVVGNARAARRADLRRGRGGTMNCGIVYSAAGMNFSVYVRR